MSFESMLITSYGASIWRGPGAPKHQIGGFRGVCVKSWSSKKREVFPDTYNIYFHHMNNHEDYMPELILILPELQNLSLIHI